MSARFRIVYTRPQALCLKQGASRLGCEPVRTCAETYPPLTFCSTFSILFSWSSRWERVVRIIIRLRNRASASTLKLDQATAARQKTYRTPRYTVSPFRRVHCTVAVGCFLCTCEEVHDAVDQLWSPFEDASRACGLSVCHTYAFEAGSP